jgi:DNA-binding LytR/AlgR family response regulator
MKVLIIEDELPAQAKLEMMLKEIDSAINIVGKIGSVKETIRWLQHNPQPDAAFVDIQLSDDHSFEIFKKYPCHFPVIFTTAYDKYLLDSFEFNSIDYLLKPVTAEKLKRSLEKIKKLQQHFLQGNTMDIGNMLPDKGRIIVKKGTEFIALNLDDVAYFYIEHKIVFARDFAARQLITDKNLGELEAMLGTKDFFRLNRKFIASLKAIERFKPDNGKILVFLKPETKEEVHVSKETAPEFRLWISGKSRA